MCFRLPDCAQIFAPDPKVFTHISGISRGFPKSAISGFYTKLSVWGSLGLNFDYEGGPIIENGGPIFLYKRRILEGSTSFHEGI